MFETLRNYLLLLGLVQVVGGTSLLVSMHDEITTPLGWSYCLLGLVSFALPWSPSKAVGHYLLMINAALLGFGAVFIPIFCLIDSKGLEMLRSVIPWLCAVVCFVISYRAHQLSRQLQELDRRAVEERH